MRIKDIDHALRVTKALVEQAGKMEMELGPKHIKVDMEGEPQTLQYFTTKLLMFSALVEGAKALLEQYEIAKDRLTGHPDDISRAAAGGTYAGIQIAIEVSAAKWVPKMLEVGMKVPG